jgi:hypothetical protein
MKFNTLALTLILALSFTSAKAQNIVLNPGFETGIATDVGVYPAPDWTPTPSASGSYYYVGNEEPNTGLNEVDFGSQSGQFDYISQTLSTVIGTTYDVSFFVSVSNVTDCSGDQAATPSNELIANIGGSLGAANGTTAGGATNYITGGTTLADIVNSTDTPYTEYTGTFTAVDTSTNLIFGGYNGPDFDYLDDISVTAQTGGGNITTNAVPEPSQYGLMLLAAVALVIRKRLSVRLRSLALI